MPFAGWLANLLNLGWLRNLLGVRKDLIDTKKAQLEIEKLEDERRARRLITLATLGDVIKYDPGVERLIRKILDDPDQRGIQFGLIPTIIEFFRFVRRTRFDRWFWLIVIIEATIFVGFLIYMGYFTNIVLD